MSFSNLEYLYDHLPARYRQDDTDLLLKGFLTWYGETLDGFDEKHAALHENINPQTATEEWITFNLSFFNWGWFPAWFTLEQKRAFYASIAMHYARRGTARGIQEFMAVFGVEVIVEAEEYYWGDVAWGEDIWLTEPLVLVFRVLPGALLSVEEIDELFRFQWPIAHVIYIENLSAAPEVPLWGTPLFGE